MIIPSNSGPPPRRASLLRRGLLAVGGLVMAVGVLGIVVGFAGFLDTGEDQVAPVDQTELIVTDGVIPDVGAPEAQDPVEHQMSLFLFGLGGLGLVAGLGLIYFARLGPVVGGAGYSRVVIEHGHGTPVTGIGCPTCGHLNSRGDQHCGGCGRVRG